MDTYQSFLDSVVNYCCDNAAIKHPECSGAMAG